MLYFSEASKSTMKYVFKNVFWRFNSCEYSCSYKYITRYKHSKWKGFRGNYYANLMFTSHTKFSNFIKISILY